MSTLVTTEFFAQPGRGDDVAKLLLEILGESLNHYDTAYLGEGTAFVGTTQASDYEPAVRCKSNQSSSAPHDSNSLDR